MHRACLKWYTVGVLCVMCSSKRGKPEPPIQSHDRTSGSFGFVFGSDGLRRSNLHTMALNMFRRYGETEWLPGLRPLPWPLWSGGRTRTALAVGAGWALSCVLAIALHYLLVRMQWLSLGGSGEQLGLDPCFVIALLWVLWADWHYGVLLAAATALGSTMLVRSVGWVDVPVILAQPLAVMVFHFFLSAFRPDPRIVRLRDVGLFVAAGFFASAAGASFVYGAMAGATDRPVVELAQMWAGWWVGHTLSMVLVGLPLVVLLGDHVEDLKDKHFPAGPRHGESLRRQVLASSLSVLVLVVFITSWTQAANAQLGAGIAAAPLPPAAREELEKAFRVSAYYQAIAIAGLVGLVASGVVLWLVQQRRFNDRLAHELEERTGNLRRKQLHLAALQSISAATARSMEPEGAALQIAENMARIFEPASVSVYLRDPLDPTHLWRAALSEVGFSSVPGARLSMDGSMAGHIIWKGEPVVLRANDRVLPKSFQDELRDLKARTCVGVPIVGEQFIMGMVQVLFSHDHVGEPEEESLYRMLGRSAGAAMERAETYSTSRRRAEILDALYRVTQELAAESEVAPLMRCATRAGRHVLHATTATIVLRVGPSLENTVLKVASMSGQPAGEIPHPAWSFAVTDEGLVAESIREGRTRSEGIRPQRPRRISLAPGWKASVVISAPLMVGGTDVMGALVLTFAPGMAVGPEELGMAEELARQTGAGLRRARLLEETRRQAAELALFDRIGRALAEQMRVSETLTQLVRQVAKVFPAERMGVLEYEGKRNVLVLRNCSAPPPEPGDLVLPLDTDALAVTAFRHARTVTTKDMRNDPDLANDPFLAFNTRSGIFVPLGSPDRPLGVLFGTSPLPRDFTAEETRRLEQAAGLASSALERAHLYDEVRARAEELALLNRVAEVLVETPLLETSLRQIAELVRKHFRSAGASFLLVEPNGNEMAVHGASGMQSDKIRNLRLPMREGGFAKLVLSSPQPIAVTDFQADERLSPEIREALATVQSAVAVPMTASKGPLGILVLYEDGEREYRADEIQQLKEVARFAAAAVERGELGQALRATEARLQEILDGIPALVISLDPKGHILSFNATAESVTGYRRDEVLSLEVIELLITDADEQRQMREMLDGVLSEHRGEILALTRLKRRDGGERRIRWTGRPLRRPDGKLDGVVAMGTDVTEHTRLEEQFLQAQKMESVGALAGGMAHGFNNLLGGILGQASLLRAQLSPNDPRREIVSKVEAAAQRGADLNRKLLAFARKSVLQPMPLDVGELVTETTELLAGSIPRTIAVRSEIESDLPPVLGDATQLQQVLMNLCVNARDAMPGGGELSLRACREGDAQVRLEIQDSGTGMSDDVKTHLFEPFFTTKEPGRGTGLGLAVVFGIVRSHGGSVAVDSEEGKGTRFVIRLPAKAGEEPKGTRVKDKIPERAAIEGNEKVFVIDDESIMRATCAELLSGLGYKVETAPSGSEALETLDAGEFKPDVVILDLMMPGLSGVPLLRELQERMPQVPVVLISGYFRDAGVRDMLDAGACELVPKPFKIEDLGGAIRRALDGSLHGDTSG